MNYVYEDLPTHQKRMECLLDECGERLLAHVPIRPRHVLCVARTDGLLPKMIIDARREALPFRVTGVTKNFNAVTRARNICTELRGVGVPMNPEDFHICRGGPNTYGQGHMHLHDIAFFIPLLNTKEGAGAEENLQLSLMNACNRCIGALEVGGRLVLVLCNPVHSLTQIFREECLRTIDTSLVYRRMRTCAHEVLQIHGLSVPGQLNREASEMFTSCELIVADKPPQRYS
ncbi:MAG: hypothetical protein KBD24_00650 [Candidatus Pacebacteria bacterium]|nr:hypothetical protein [Candidatus Paceibacterota bacterium]